MFTLPILFHGVPGVFQANPYFIRRGDSVGFFVPSQRFREIPISGKTVPFPHKSGGGSFVLGSQISIPPGLIFLSGNGRHAPGFFFRSTIELGCVPGDIFFLCFEVCLSLVQKLIFGCRINLSYA